MRRYRDRDEAYDIARQTLADALADGQPTYIPPQVLVELRGKEYEIPVYYILKDLGATSLEVNRYQLQGV